MNVICQKAYPRAVRAIIRLQKLGAHAVWSSAIKDCLAKGWVLAGIRTGQKVA